jgi:hypothetical protein
MMTTEAMQTAEFNDAELVAESLDGNRDAFRQIVERYQTLISSLAYCATGDVSQSEDLAQETFVSAWKQLADLRERNQRRHISVCLQSGRMAGHPGSTALERRCASFCR